MKKILIIIVMVLILGTLVFAQTIIDGEISLINKNTGEIEMDKINNENFIDFLINDIKRLNNRITFLENQLNITYIEPEENSLPLYYCAIEKSTKECPGGISGGFNTRCYLDQPKQAPWDYCLDGWALQ